jgi:hypothetical protein
MLTPIPFVGTIRGPAVIHVDINVTNNNRVAGFVGHMGEHSVINGIELRGSIQGTGVVGGLVGWSDNAGAGSIGSNNVAALNVSSSLLTGQRTIVGQLVGAAVNPHVDWLGANVCCIDCDAITWIVDCCGHWPVGFPDTRPLTLPISFLAFDIKEPEQHDPLPDEPDYDPDNDPDDEPDPDTADDYPNYYDPYDDEPYYDTDNEPYDETDYEDAPEDGDEGAYEGGEEYEGAYNYYPDYPEDDYDFAIGSGNSGRLYRL